MLSREKEKVYVSSTYLDLKLSHVEVAAKPYPVGYVVPQFHNVTV